MKQLARYLSGHLWTVIPTVRHSLRPGPAPPARPWSTTLRDPAMGPVTLQGWLSDPAAARTCLVVVHGLGGTTDAFYCRAAARAAERAGLAHLRLALRGADRRGDDFYHAALVDDLAAALASPDLARFEHLLVLGYSLGGHMVLRYALSPTDPRVRAVAAVCPPLYLDRSAEAINRPAARLYQRAVLRGLNEIYRAVAARRPLTVPLSRVLAARTLREWDSLAVVPRHGFASVDDYYTRASAGPVLEQLRVPALIVASERDPMVPPWTYGDLTSRVLPRVTLRMLDSGGHVAFPGAGRVEHDTLAWLLAHRPAETRVAGPGRDPSRLDPLS